MKKFWLVTRDPSTVGYHNPTHAHFTKKEASASAERLCKETGHVFFILEAMEFVKQSKPPIEWVAVPEITAAAPKKKTLKRARNIWGQFTSDWVYDY